MRRVVIYFAVGLTMCGVGLAGSSRIPKAHTWEELSEHENNKIVEHIKTMSIKKSRDAGMRLQLVETPHFLIFTNWPEKDQEYLKQVSERTYLRLAQQFNLPARSNVWYGKCAVFALLEGKQLLAFAEKADGMDEGRSDVGYCYMRSDGYVHIALRRTRLRQQFAEVFAHECSHAFLHRLWSPRHVDSWLNEGLAEVISGLVVRGSKKVPISHKITADWFSHKSPPADIFTYKQSPPAEYYPLCMNLVEFMIRANRKAFVRLIFEIKQGTPTEDALRHTYKTDYSGLVRAWSGWVKSGFRNK
jgi:hypothetical protein